jgi:hypothetical protein
MQSHSLEVLEILSLSQQQTFLLVLYYCLGKRRKTSKISQVKGTQCANPYSKHNLLKIPEGNAIYTIGLWDAVLNLVNETTQSNPADGRLQKMEQCGICGATRIS